MREVEFRGKCVYGGEWVYGYLEYHLIDGDLTKTEKKAFITYETMDSVGQVYRHQYQVDVETVGQYTGLKDSKRTDEFPEGQKIYEGDIVKKHVDNKHSCYGKTKIYRNYLIEFKDLGFKFTSLEKEPYVLELGSGEIEVIGNIHDNPELTT